MDALFGIPMNSIMIVLLALLAVSLASVAYVALRNRIIFLIGLRNIPRRVAQTVLIIVGLMLSTLIISAAFATGDTVDYSISNQAYSLLGHIDETVQPQSLGDAGTQGDSSLDVTADQYQRFQAALQQANNADVDGSTGVLFEEVPVVNPTARLSEPSVTFAGVDTTYLQGFPDVISASSGDTLDVTLLAPDQAYMNESAADKLYVRPGDRVQVWVQNRPHDFTIVDVVKDRVLTGANRQDNQEGMVTRLDTLHQLVGHDRVSFVAVSNVGGVRDSVSLTDPVERDLKQLIKQSGLQLDLGSSKQDAVDQAEQFGNFMATFFLLLGLFSIGAGMLLIVMIFVMLAAERRPEMGMARAVGTKRGHLVQMFMSEGMAYNVLSAMVGAALGIVVAFGMAYVMSAIFASSSFNISIQPHVTARTLAISYALGVVLTFATVTFASWRVSNLNIVAAIRGTSDIRPPEERRRTRWLWVLLAIPAMIAPPLGLWLLLRKGFGLPWAWIVAGGGLILGSLFSWLGLDSNQAFPFALGFSLIAAGVARTLGLFKLPDRPVYTAVGGLLLVFWGFVAGGRLEFLFGKLQGDIEMFFLSGIAMVTASTFVVVYNADLILAVVSRLGGAFGSILPAMKTAVAYPLANRFRTGMTLAMISLVVFALTMMSTMNLNFDKLFLDDSARGGWDIVVQENPNNPISDLSAALRTSGSTAPNGFRTNGRLSLAGGPAATQARQDPNSKFEEFQIFGVNDGFIEGGNIPLEQRARGFESDDAVWQALKSRDDAALIDAFATGRGGFRGEGSFQVSGIREGDRVFDPISVQIHDPKSGRSRSVQIIGVIGVGASVTFPGLYIPDRTFQDVFGEPDRSWHYVGLQNPDQSKDVAKEIESTLLTAGVQAVSLKERADEQQALSRNFFYLMQAFMGLGLFVGIAAVGVIAFRTVVERRQQIGMLRAIGYKRSTVALSFLLESSFVTLLGLASGIGLAIWLSYFLVTSDQFPSQGSGYHIPWPQIFLLAVFTFLASLVMTYIPARQAATIPVAEALRYE